MRSPCYSQGGKLVADSEFNFKFFCKLRFLILMSRDLEFEFTPPLVPIDPNDPIAPSGDRGPLSPDQLGYQPSIYNSKFSRRNSLPQPFLTHSPLLGSPQLGAHSPHSPHSFDQQSNSLHGSPQMVYVAYL